MATLLCDVCSGALVMNAGGENATCASCGISYSVERLREKAKAQNIQSGVTVNVVNNAPAQETQEELEFLAKKYLRLSDWENAEKLYSKILDRSPTDENAFDILNKLKMWKHMEVENGVLKKYTGKFGEVVLPSSVTSIGIRAFSGNKGAHTIIFTDNVETIEREAFSQNRDLKRILGLSKVKFIGKSAFCDCSSLEDCDIGDDVEYISDEAFKGCTSLKSIRLPENLKQLERGTFKGCSSLEELLIPKSISVISASLFEQCVSLKRVNIPNEVTKIETNAFYGCKGLEEITIPSSVTELQPSCFKETGLLTIDLPETLTEIPVQCFERCEMMTHITIPKSVKKLGDKAFYYCTAMTSITLEHDTSVGRQVFFNCRKLMYVNPAEENRTTTSVALIDLTETSPQDVSVLPLELFSAFKGTPYYNSEILRRKANKLCERCAGKLGLFGKCKVCGFKSTSDKR